MNILIVEDEPNYADTLEMFVDELGYHITGLAEEGQKALKLFRENAPDLVLLDINIEGEMSGIDLARIFQAERPTPVIFITSYDDKETFNKAKETVPCDYLIKPFDPDQLERSMELATVRAYAPSPDEDVFEDSAKGDLSLFNDYGQLYKRQGFRKDFDPDLTQNYPTY